MKFSPRRTYVVHVTNTRTGETVWTEHLRARSPGAAVDAVNREIMSAHAFVRRGKRPTRSRFMATSARLSRRRAV